MRRESNAKENNITNTLLSDKKDNRTPRKIALAALLKATLPQTSIVCVHNIPTF
jgi:hypothetical protein